MAFNVNTIKMATDNHFTLMSIFFIVLGLGKQYYKILRKLFLGFYELGVLFHETVV